MKTVERVIQNIKQEEIDGKHERTYLLMDAFDMLCGEHDIKDNEILNKNLEDRLGYFVNAGAVEARKEMLIFGGVALVVGSGVYFVTKKIKKHNGKTWKDFIKRDEEC